MPSRLRFPIAAITDEFSADLGEALHAMKAVGMTGAELRVISEKNIMDLTDDELAQVQEQLGEFGFEMVSIASPLLKCVLPGVGDVDHRFQHDIFASRHTYEDQPRLAERAIFIAKLLGAKIIRVFSYWRTTDPARAFDKIAKALEQLANQAAKEGLIIGIENEHACHIGIAAEAKQMLDAVKHPNLQLVWDPANAYVAGEEPFPTGYNLLPKDRIAHVHAKDCLFDGTHAATWGPVGCGEVDWKGQIAALVADSYAGWISLETHWPGPHGDKKLGSTICGWNLRTLVSVPE